MKVMPALLLTKKTLSESNDPPLGCKTSPQEPLPARPLAQARFSGARLASPAARRAADLAADPAIAPAAALGRGA